jgi:hypothetical protein
VTNQAGTTGALASFSEPTRTWFEAAFAAPTPAQTGAWNAIAAGRNALVVAPTGSGKTLSAFLWSLDRIATTPRPGEGPAAAPPSLAGGVLLGVANPKAWVAIAAVFASTRLAGTATADAAAKVAVLSLVMVLIMVAWLLAGACFASTLRDPGRARVVNLALAAALVGSTALAVLR